MLVLLMVCSLAAYGFILAIRYIVVHVFSLRLPRNITENSRIVSFRRLALTAGDSDMIALFARKDGYPGKKDNASWFKRDIEGLNW